MVDPTQDDAGDPIAAADASTPFSFAATVPPTFCDICGAELVNGDQTVGTGSSQYPYRHAVCNALGYREATAESEAGQLPDGHTR